MARLARNNRVAFALALIFLFHAANNIIVLRLDNAPLFNDEAFFFVESWDFLQGGWNLFAVSVSASTEHAPLHRLLVVPFYLLFGYFPDVAVLSTLIAALVLIVAVYHIGKDLHSRESGLLAACLAVLLPGLFGHSRTYLIEFTLAAAVALSIALMLKTRGFSHRGYLLAFSASIGAGLLVKWSFSAYLLGPILAYLYAWCRKDSTSCGWRAGLLRRGRSLALAVFIGLLLASWWYLPNLAGIARHIRVVLRSETLDASILDVRNILFYPKSWFLLHVGPVLSVAAICSLAALSARKREGAFLLLMWLFLPYVIFTFVFVEPKEPRFLVPAIAAIAVVLALAWTMVPRRSGYAIAAAIAVLALAQFGYVTYLRGPVDPNGKFGQGLLSPDRRDWQMPAILGILDASPGLRQNASFSYIPPHDYSLGTFETYQRMGMIPSFSLKPSVEFAACLSANISCRTYEDYVRLLNGSGVVLAGRQRPFPEDPSAAARQDTLLRAWNKTGSSFARVLSIREPYYYLDVYAKT